MKGSSYVNNNNCNTSIPPVIIIENSGTEAQQTKSLKCCVIIKGTANSRHWSRETPNNYGGKAISNIYFSSFYESWLYSLRRIGS